MFTKNLGYLEREKEAIGESSERQNVEKKQSNKIGKNNDSENYNFGVKYLGVTADHKLKMNVQNRSENKNAILGRVNENLANKSVEIIYHEDCLLPKLYEVLG